MTYKNLVLGVKDNFRRFGNNSEGLDQGLAFIQVYGLIRFEGRQTSERAS